MDSIKFYLPLAWRWLKEGDVVGAWLEIQHIVWETLHVHLPPRWK